MADVTATFGLDDREFRKGVDKLMGKSDEVARRMEQGFGKSFSSFGRGVGIFAALAFGVNSVKNAFKNAEAQAETFAKFNAEGAASLARLNKEAERHNYLVGMFGIQYKEAKAQLAGFLETQLLGEGGSAAARRDFQAANFGKLSGQARLLADEGSAQEKFTREDERHRQVMDDLKAEFEAQRLDPNQYRDLRDAERSNHSERVGRLVEEENQRSAAAAKERRDADARAAKDAADASKRRADALFGLEMDQKRMEIDLLRAQGKAKEADILKVQLDTIQKIHQINQDDALTQQEKINAAARAERDSAELAGLLGSEERGSRKQGFSGRATLASGLGPRAGVFSSGSGGGQDKQLDEQKKIRSKLEQAVQVLDKIEAKVGVAAYA